MKYVGLIVLVVLGLRGPVAAQTPPSHPAPPTENVTVTGIKDIDAAVSKFVGDLTAPTRVAGKLARWERGVCPITVGLRPVMAKFVTGRVKEIAAQVGAPVNREDNCKPNIEIVFTTAPQTLLDNISVMHPYMLGYHDSSAQAAELAAVTHPIQAWYTTATDDLRGNPQIDSGRSGGMTMQMAKPGTGIAGSFGASSTPYYEMNLSNATARNITGGRLGDGLSSEFNHVVVVGEPAKLLDYEMGTVADYIAMLALSQPTSLDSCQELPTILNLLAKDCAMPPKAITLGDIAYLRAIYKTTATATFQVQRREMIYQMDRSLGAQRRCCSGSKTRHKHSGNR